MTINYLGINGKFLAQKITGVQRFALNIVKALDLAYSKNPPNYQVTIFVPSNKNIDLDLNFIKVKSVWCPFKSTILFEQFVLPIIARKYLLLNLSGSTPLIKCFNNIICIFDCSFLVNKEAYSFLFRNWYNLLYRINFLTAKSILTVSQFSKNTLIKAFGSRDYEVIYSSAEHIRDYQDSNSEEILRKNRLIPGKYVVSVGSLNPTKNFANLLEAYKISKSKSIIPLVIVGGTNSKVFSKNVIPDHHLNIIYTGFINDVELYSLYKNAALFVFPSIYEGFGIPPLEAMELGCPVIASTAASIPEVCGDAALYFDPYVPKSIADAIDYAIENPRIMNRYKILGLERAKLFTWESSATKLRKILDRELSKQS